MFRSVARVSLALCVVVACGRADDGVDVTASSTNATTGAGGGGGSGSGAGGSASAALAVESPAADSEVLWSAALAMKAPGGAARIIVVHGGSGASCEAVAPYFECLLDLADADVGVIDLTLSAQDDDGAELASLAHRIRKREVPVPCTGDGGMLSSCILDRAMAGTSAGFEGVSYINADDTHANVNTSTMTGIDHRVLEEPPASVPAGVRMGVVNESRSWQPTGGWCSMPRCFAGSRRDRAMDLYAENQFFFWPEHRDHGLRDFYMWQAPFFALSQGSSSSERDEVAKVLRALGIMSIETRDAAEQAKLLGPIMSLLLVRSRVESDLDYMTTEAFPTALDNLDNAERLLAMAAALRADELLPVGTIAAHSQDFPAGWGSFNQVLDSPYAIGFAPSMDNGPHAEAFSVDLDLEATDANGRRVLFFPAVLRGDASVTVQRTGEASYRITGDYPEDRMLMTNGIERIVARTTVAFFPHNGVWLGAPVMVSVGGHPAEEVATNANNAD